MSENQYKVITVGRDYLTVWKKTAALDFDRVLRSMGISKAKFKINRSNNTIEYNNNLMQVIGYNDDSDKVEGLAQDAFWCNETITVPQVTIDSLMQRTSEFCVLDYNPKEADSYLYSLWNLPYAKGLKTTFLQNPFIPRMAKRKILSYEPTPENILNGTDNAYRWKVYGLGERAVGDEVIFPEWQIYDDDEITGEDHHYAGSDFGHVTDPTTIIDVKIKGNKLFLREKAWRYGMNTAEHVALFKGNNEVPIIGDSQEARLITDMQIASVNIWPCIKGPDSVWHGLRRMKDYAIFVHKDSVNLQKEFRSYKWAKDKQGNYLRNSKGFLIPIDAYNHGIDAARYVVSYPVISPNLK